MNGAATANRRLRFLGFARNDIRALRIRSWGIGPVTYCHLLGRRSERSEESQNLVLKAGYRGATRLNARPGFVNGAATANRRLRFLGFARNDIRALRIRSWGIGPVTYCHLLGRHSERSEESQNLVLKAGCRGATRLNARPGFVNGAATANRRLRFLGFARNDIRALRIRSWAVEMPSLAARWRGL